MKKIKEIILVIDDNDINRRYVKTVLRDPSREVLLAESGFRAMELIEEYLPTLLLIDIQMPLMDGFECYNLMRKKLGPKIPMLAITAFSTSHEGAEFIRYGFNDSIMKPVRPEVLKNVVTHWLDQSESNKQEHPGLEQLDFDLVTISELKRHADITELIELYNEFIEETNFFNGKLAVLQATGNCREILSILHTIKGNAGSLGFAKLSELISRLEEDMKSDKNVSLPIRIKELTDYSSEIFSVYKSQLTLNT